MRRSRSFGTPTASRSVRARHAGAHAAEPPLAAALRVRSGRGQVRRDLLVPPLPLAGGLNLVATLEASARLRHLRDLGLLEQRGKGSAAYYVPTPMLLGAAGEPDGLAPGGKDKSWARKSRRSEKKSRWRIRSTYSQQCQPHARRAHVPLGVPGQHAVLGILHPLERHAGRGAQRLGRAAFLPLDSLMSLMYSSIAFRSFRLRPSAAPRFKS